MKGHSRAHGLGEPVEQLLCELQETVEDKLYRTQAQMEDALESREKVIFLVLFDIL